ncbi:MAG: cupin domain-containing protein [Janthinobacterium lividum]
MRCHFRRYNGVLSVTPGHNFLVLGSHFVLDGDAGFLLDALPPNVMLETELQKQALRWAVERMISEMRDPQPDGMLVTQQVAYTMLVEALCLYIRDNLHQGASWFSALADKRMMIALSSIHQEPARS